MNRCIVHVGMHKTGTSSIQQSLNGFADESFVYANIDGAPNHSPFLIKLFAENSNAQGGEVKSDDFTVLDRVINEAGGRTLLFSGEGLSFFSINALKKMRDHLLERFEELSIVASVRAPAGYMASSFQEPIKRGALNYLKLSQRYRSYKNTFNKFDEVFGRENVQLWKFDPKSFPGGCAVQDFVRRLKVDFPIKRIVRVNEAISREAIGLLFIYRKLGGDLGSMKMTGPQNNQLVRKIMKIGKSKFRFAPNAIQPILDNNRADIEWMENRLGASLYEDLGQYKSTDVIDESDLMNVRQATIDELRLMLGRFAPRGITGQTPEEIAQLVHCLRRLSRAVKWTEKSGGDKHAMTKVRAGTNQGDRALFKVTEVIERIKKVEPDLLIDIQEESAAELVRNAFQLINQSLSDSDRGTLRYDQLGRFEITSTEQINTKKQYSGQKIRFVPEGILQDVSMKLALKNTGQTRKVKEKRSGVKANCTLHIGMHKTGTSSIQRSLRGFENDQFVYFSGAKKYGNHGDVILRLLESDGGAHRPGSGRTANYIDTHAAARKEIEGSVDLLQGRNLLFSGEVMRFLSVEELKRLRRFFYEMGMTVSVVGYIRSPAAFFTSLTQQLIKKFNRNSLQLNWAYCNYQQSFNKFDEVFGADNVQLWKFDPKTFLNGCVVQDFCRRIGIDFPADRIVRENESLSREALALLYVYKKFGYDKETTEMSRQESQLLEYQISKIGGEKFRISADLLRPLIKANYADVEWMEKRLGESLHEDVGQHQPGSIRNELDLLSHRDDGVIRLRDLIGGIDSTDVEGKTPEETAQMVHIFWEQIQSKQKTNNLPKRTKGMLT